MFDVVADLRWWAAKKKWPKNCAAVADACSAGADEIERLRVRVLELEKACGAAAIANGLDMIRDGQLPEDAEENSAVVLSWRAMGIDISKPTDLLRFLSEYKAKHGKEGDAG